MGGQENCVSGALESEMGACLEAFTLDRAVVSVCSHGCRYRLRSLVSVMVRICKFSLDSFSLLS